MKYLRPVAKLMTVVLAASMFTACTSINAKPLDTGKMVTRVMFAEECPVSPPPLKEIKEDKMAIGPAVALAVIPPLVDAGIKGIGNAIKKAGESAKYSTSAG